MPTRASAKHWRLKLVGGGLAGRGGGGFGRFGGEVDDFDGGAVDDAFGGVGDDLVGWGEAVDDFEFGAHVAAGLDFSQVDFAVFYDGDVDAGGVKAEGGGGDEEGGVFLGELDLGGAVHAGIEAAILVGEIEFKEHGAGGLIDGGGGAGDDAEEIGGGVIGDVEVGGSADLDVVGVGLGDVDEGAEFVDFGDAEHFLAGGGIGGGEESADIVGAGGDDAVKGSEDFFESLQGAEAVNGGLGGDNVGLGGMYVGAGLGDIALGLGVGVFFFVQFLDGDGIDAIFL